VDRQSERHETPRCLYIETDCVVFVFGPVLFCSISVTFLCYDRVSSRVSFLGHKTSTIAGQVSLYENLKHVRINV